MTHASSPKLRLLERLLCKEALTIDDHVSTVLLSIRQHLELLLNSRSESCRSAPDLGLRDFHATGQTRADLHTRLAEEIRLCISHYEPRLQQIRVSAMPLTGSDQDPLQLQFHIAGEIRFADQAQRASFTLLMDGCRRYRMVN